VLATLTSFRSGALVPVDPGPMAPHHHADGTVHVH
jgi:urease accessory protein